MKLMSDLAAFRRTLRELPDIPAHVWVTSHHRGVYTDRAHFLEDLAAFAGKIDEREQRLLELLAARPRDLDELAAIGLLYKPDVDIPWRDFAERRTIEQHLEELLARGQVVNGGGRFELAA